MKCYILYYITASRSLRSNTFMYSDALRLRRQEERTGRANESYLYLQQLGMYLSRDFFYQ